MTEQKQKYTVDNAPIICVDLDGTFLNEDRYPDYGDPNAGAVETLNAMVQKGYEVIIWTCREDKVAYEIVEKSVKESGLNPNVKINIHANRSLAKYPTHSAKVFGNIYLDDRAYGTPDYSKVETWRKIYSEFIGEEPKF